MLKSYITTQWSKKNFSPKFILSLIGLLGLLCFGCEDPKPPPIPKLRGHHLVWKKKLPITGKKIRTPGLSGPSSKYRILVTGIVTTGKYGENLTAEHRTDQAGVLRLSHNHLKFSPDELVSHHRDRVHYEYLYEWDKKVSLKNKRITISFEGLAYRFRVSPKKLKQESESTLTVSVWRKGKPNIKEWIYYLSVGALILMLLGLFWLKKRFQRK